MVFELKIKRQSGFQESPRFHQRIVHLLFGLIACGSDLPLLSASGRIHLNSGPLFLIRKNEASQETAFPDDFRPASVTTRAASQAGVEQVAQGIAEQVDSENDNDQAEAGPEGQVRGQFHILPPFVAEHPAPAGLIGRQSESEKTERRFGQDHPAERQGVYDNQGGQNIGQDVPE